MYSRWCNMGDMILHKRLAFLDMLQTVQHPDIVIWFIEQKFIFIIELIVLWAKAVRRVINRQICAKQGRGGKTWLFPVEVGCQGIQRSEFGSFSR